MLKKTIVALFISGILTACGSGGDDSPNGPINFNVANASALALSSSDNIRSNASTGYKIDVSDEVEPITNHTVTAMRVFGDEVFLEVLIGGGEGSAQIAYFVVQKDNSYMQLDVNGMPVHQSESGLIVFSDASLYDPSTQVVSKIDSGMTAPTIQTASGNFAVLSDHRDGVPYSKVYNLETGDQFDVESCNGPRLVALSSTKAAVDDCSGEILMDMTTGERQKIDVELFNGESLYIGDGALIIWQTADGSGGWKWTLNHVDEQGSVTNVIDTDLKTSVECMNCFNINKELFHSPGWIAVNGNSLLTVKDLTTGEQKEILSDVDVHSIDLNNDEILYTGTLKNTPERASVTGVYNLSADVDRRHMRSVNLGYIENF